MRAITSRTSPEHGGSPCDVCAASPPGVGLPHRWCVAHCGGRGVTCRCVVSLSRLASQPAEILGAKGSERCVV